MKSTSFRRVVAPGIAALTLTLGLSACGAANEEGSGNGDTAESLSGTLNGAGASSQEAAQALSLIHI